MDVILLSGGINVGAWIQRYIGPYKIAHWIRKHGYTAQVIDFADRANEDTLYKMIKRFVTNETKIIGISSTFLSNNMFTWQDGRSNPMPEHVITILEKIKQEYPTIKIVLGGYQSERLSSYDVIDASIMSYTHATEDIFLEYLQHLHRGTPRPKSQIIFPFLEQPGKHRTHFDEANNPTYNIEVDDFQFIKQDYILPNEALPLDVSRGCIFACRFCQFPHIGKKKLDYIRGMNYIEEEIQRNYENFGTKNYYVLDDTFNDTEIKLQEFYNMTQRLSFKIDYSAFIRADLIHRFPNMAPLLKDSGLSGAFHGIESFHPAASKVVGKAWSGTHAREYLPKLYHDIWDKKVAMQTAFIVGLTGDTLENVKSTANWFVENQMPSIQFYPLILFGKNPDGTKRTVQSEFDVNSEKYGYTITAQNPVNWYNDNWTKDSASKTAQELIDYVAPYKKHAAWTVQTLLWYGHDKETIQNTYQHQYSKSLMEQQTRDFLNLYFSKVLGE